MNFIFFPKKFQLGLTLRVIGQQLWRLNGVKCSAAKLSHLNDAVVGLRLPAC